MCGESVIKIYILLRFIGLFILFAINNIDLTFCKQYAVMTIFECHVINVIN